MGTPKKYNGVQGTIYLLHFEKPYQHARHYLGWSAELNARLSEHHAGRGSKLMAAVVQAGIPFVVARTWTGDTFDERRLHRQNNSPRLCPICNPPS